MAVKTYRVALGLDGNFGALSDGVDVAAATRADGWTVAKLSATNESDFDAGTKQASGSFAIGQGKPVTLLTGSTANAFRTPLPLNGSFANTNWVFTFAVRATVVSAQAGRMVMTIWRGPNADGSGATLIANTRPAGSGLQGTVTSTLSTTADVTTAVTWTPGAVLTLVNEYLFFVLAWQTTTAGGSNSADVLIRTGQAAAGSRLVTPDYTQTPGTTQTFATTITRAAAVAVQANNIVPFAASVAGTGAVFGTETVLPPPISFEIDLQTNQPYAGEWDAGEFLAGKEPILWVDLVQVLIDFLEGGIAGQAQVSASMEVIKGLAANVAGAAAVTAQQSLVRGLAASLAGAGAVSPQMGVGRNLSTVTVSGLSSVTADIIRVTLTVAYVAPVAGAAVVAPSLEVDAPNYVNLGSSVAGQAAVTAQTVRTTNLPSQIAGQAAVATGIQTSAAIPFQALVVGKGDISAAAARTVSFSASVAGASAVSATNAVIRVVTFECRIETLIPLCGEHLCGVFNWGGPFICGGFSGPHSVIDVNFVRFLSWLEFPVAGKAVVISLLRPSTSLASDVAGQANVVVNLNATLGFFAEIGGQAQVVSPLNLRLNMPAQIVGKAELKVKLTYDWLAPTDPEDILLPPTTEIDWILIPTTPVDSVLVPTAGAVEVLTPTDEEDWILVPTTERSM